LSYKAFSFLTHGYIHFPTTTTTIINMKSVIFLAIASLAIAMPQRGRGGGRGYGGRGWEGGRGRGWEGGRGYGGYGGGWGYGGGFGYGDALLGDLVEGTAIGLTDGLVGGYGYPYYRQVDDAAAPQVQQAEAPAA